MRYGSPKIGVALDLNGIPSTPAHGFHNLGDSDIVHEADDVDAVLPVDQACAQSEHQDDGTAFGVDVNADDVRGQ